MIASQMDRQGERVDNSSVRESFGAHLRKIAAAAGWAVAPIVAVLLAIGNIKLALSIAGGGLVSFFVFASLRFMVYRAVDLLAGQPDARPGPAAMAQFAMGTFVKFIIAIAVVYGMFRLHANLPALLAGFVIAQIAIAVTVSRGFKNPVA